MDFSIRITEIAAKDIDEAVTYIAIDSPSAAQRWKAELETQIFSLAVMPARFAVIPESDDLGALYRSAIHYSHRIIFRIDDEERVVYVVRVYHGLRRPITYRDLIEEA
jgi:plasmid stabilization system protein ParE